MYVCKNRRSNQKELDSEGTFIHILKKYIFTWTVIEHEYSTQKK